MKRQEVWAAALVRQVMPIGAQQSVSDRLWDHNWARLALALEEFTVF